MASLEKKTHHYHHLVSWQKSHLASQIAHKPCPHPEQQDQCALLKSISYNVSHDTNTFMLFDESFVFFTMAAYINRLQESTGVNWRVIELEYLLRLCHTPNNIQLNLTTEMGLCYIVRIFQSKNFAVIFQGTRLLHVVGENQSHNKTDIP